MIHLFYWYSRNPELRRFSRKAGSPCWRPRTAVMENDELLFTKSSVGIVGRTVVSWAKSLVLAIWGSFALLQFSCRSDVGEARHLHCLSNQSYLHVMAYSRLPGAADRRTESKTRDPRSIWRPILLHPAREPWTWRQPQLFFCCSPRATLFPPSRSLCKGSVPQYVVLLCVFNVK